MGMVERGDGEFELVREADEPGEVDGFINMDVHLTENMKHPPRLPGEPTTYLDPTSQYIDEGFPFEVGRDFIRQSGP